jgi:carotenoid cleavage dioxygenase-like enzyme
MDSLWLWDVRRDSRIGLLPRNGDVSRIRCFEAPLWNWSMLHCDRSNSHT